MKVIGLLDLRHALGPYTVFVSFPVTTWLVLIWAALSCVSTHNKRIWQAQRAGVLPEGDEVPPPWMSFVMVPQYAVLATMLFLNWQQALSVYVATFVAASFASGIMETIGMVLLIPFRLLQVAYKRRAQAKASDLRVASGTDASGEQGRFKHCIAATYACVPWTHDGLELEVLRVRLASQFPGLNELEVIQCIRSSVFTSKGFELPEVALARIWVSPSGRIELDQLQLELERTKAEADLMGWQLKRQRLIEGRFYDPAEGRISGPEALEVVSALDMQKGASTTLSTPAVNKQRLRDALKVIAIEMLIHDEQYLVKRLHQSFVALGPDERAGNDDASRDWSNFVESVNVRVRTLQS